jgi:hypothetical protein
MDRDPHALPKCKGESGLGNERPLLCLTGARQSLTMFWRIPLLHNEIVTRIFTIRQGGVELAKHI